MSNENRLYTRDFGLVVVGQIISVFGSSLVRFALSLYVLDMTGRADVFATVYAISNIPRLLIVTIGAQQGLKNVETI